MDKTTTHGPEFDRLIALVRTEINNCDDPDDLLDIATVIVHVLTTEDTDQEG